VARSFSEIRSDQKQSWGLKESLFELLKAGCVTFCVCPGARNSAIIIYLEALQGVKLYYWPEERSAAFFALGLSRRLQAPVAVVTTSGTAVAELLPSAIEAFYTGVPLIFLTADRPKRYRGSGAPQAIEQSSLFLCYAPLVFDLEEEDSFSLKMWEQRAPCHINLCLEEPKPFTLEAFEGGSRSYFPKKKERGESSLNAFLKNVENPLVIVSTLPFSKRELVKTFLLRLKAPLILEGVSGLREDCKLQDLRVVLSSYDSVIRIGGVPTTRFWRDLETHKLPVLSVSDLPFSGLSYGEKPLPFEILNEYPLKSYEGVRLKEVREHFEGEASLIHELSKKIPEEALIYLGNSLPIRHWDEAATFDIPHSLVFASRGANGIDGQISTFFGLCEKGRLNIALIGDLTALYDLAAFWILKDLDVEQVTVVIINNGGGQIFSKMFPRKSFLNEHHLSFESIAQFWGLNYTRFEGKIGDTPLFCGKHLIEVVV
jgi:2-succinyl-5-enolpyruvyl-6-hydroxy-3-cyclohexene-1-carboxylate synthase